MNTSSCSIGDRPARRLVEQQQRRIDHQCPAHRHHLALAAGQRSGTLVDALPEPGEQADDDVDRSPTRSACAGTRPSRGSRGPSATGRRCSSAGRSRSPRCTRKCAFWPVTSSPRYQTTPVGTVIEAEHRLEHRRLAGAVRADDADNSPCGQSRSQPLRMLTPGTYPAIEFVDVDQRFGRSGASVIASPVPVPRLRSALDRVELGVPCSTTSSDHPR